MERHLFHLLSTPRRVTSIFGIMLRAPGSARGSIRILEDLAFVILTLPTQNISVNYTLTGLRLLLDATGNNLLFLDSPPLISPFPTSDLLLCQKKAAPKNHTSHKPSGRQGHPQNPSLLRPA